MFWWPNLIYPSLYHVTFSCHWILTSIVLKTCIKTIDLKKSCGIVVLMQRSFDTLGPCNNAWPRYVAFLLYSEAPSKPNSTRPEEIQFPINSGVFFLLWLKNGENRDKGNCFVWMEFPGGVLLYWKNKWKIFSRYWTELNLLEFRGN